MDDSEIDAGEIPPVLPRILPSKAAVVAAESTLTDLYSCVGEVVPLAVAIDHQREAVDMIIRQLGRVLHQLVRAWQDMAYLHGLEVNRQFIARTRISLDRLDREPSTVS